MRDRFDIATTDFVVALKFLPETRPWAASLGQHDAHLLDGAGFVEDNDTFVSAGTEAAGRLTNEWFAHIWS